ERRRGERMILHIAHIQLGDPGPLSFRCPSCYRNGTFDSITNIHDPLISTIPPSGQQSAKYFLVPRRCPNPQCRAYVFYVATDQRQAIATYPAETIDFDST